MMLRGRSDIQTSIFAGEIPAFPGASARVLFESAGVPSGRSGFSLRWFIVLSVLLHLFVFLAVLSRLWGTGAKPLLEPITAEVVEMPAWELPRIPAPGARSAPSAPGLGRSAPPGPSTRPSVDRARGPAAAGPSASVPAGPEPGVRPSAATASPRFEGAVRAVPASPGDRRPLPLLSAQSLEKFARAVPEPRSEAGRSITMDTQELKYLTYLARVREKVESAWEYPRLARHEGWQGNLYIRFTIRRDGRLGPVTLLRSSGYPVLDDAALAALRDAIPFDQFPKVWEEPDLTITGNFIYTMGGWHVR
ncbi:MAG: TonB family protein [Nitrospirae bacterium]|nr:TonB family protein [Nitrospirota bacterium]